MQGNRSVQERIKEHSRDSQFAHNKTSAEWKANISWKGERGRGPIDSRAVYTREIIGSLNNTRTDCRNNTFNRDLREPRFCNPKVLSRTHINGTIPVSRNPRLTLAINDFFFLEYSKKETILKIGHLAKTVVFARSVFVKNKKITKTCQKPLYKKIINCSVQKNNRENTKYSKNETISKLSHLARLTAIAKWSLWVKNQKCQKHAENIVQEN